MTATPHNPAHDPSVDGRRPAPTRVLTPGFTVLLAFALAALVVLIGLGNWQMRRLAWKEDLLATIEARRAADPLPLDDAIAAARAEAKANPEADYGRLDYRPAMATGVFEPGEALFYATDEGLVGWQVLAPLRLPDGRALIVNRGFVPDALMDDAALRAPPDGETMVAGLLRDPLEEKPGPFVPDNGPDVFYWKDFGAIRGRWGLTEAETVPAILDVGPTPIGEVPVGGQTIIDLPNNHLGYAATWYGIGAGLVGVVGALAWGRVRRVRAARDGGSVRQGTPAG